ncbi:MAG: hypothetical protein LH647_21700 [Leptolyngbyaceae cyanobacterium CAN_BIN12]|nr:hypothetical protein [Leptolyngbyaceae cyanobacterium CAN_BIN12]
MRRQNVPHYTPFLQNSKTFSGSSHANAIAYLWDLKTGETAFDPTVMS